MARLYSFETNSYEEVPEEHVRGMVLSKKYAFSDAEKVPVIAPDGTRHFIPGVKALEAFNRGGNYGSTEDWARIGRKEEYGEGWENYLGATLTGVARGATLGASDIIAKEILGKERMETWRDELGGVSTAAEIGGSILSAFPTGGAGAVGAGARLAARGVKASDILLASRGAFKAGRLAEDAIAGSALLARGADKSKALKIVQGALSKGTGGAVEGGLFGAGTALSESMLGDPEDVGELLIANIGYSALFGGLGNAGIHTIGVTGAASGRQMSKGIGSLYEKATGSKMSVAGQEKFIRATGSMLGVEDTDTLVKQLSWAPEQRAARAKAKGAMDDVGDNALEIYKDLNNVLADLEVVQSATRGKAKRKETLGQLFKKPSGVAKGDWAPNPQEAINKTRESLANMWETLASLGESQIKYASSAHVKKATGHLATLEKILAGETGANADEVLKQWAKEASGGYTTDLAKEAYLMLDDFKKYLGHQAFSKSAKNQMAWNAQGPMIEAWKEVHQLLEDPKIWGLAAETQRKVNAKFSPFIKSLQGFRKAFGESGESALISNNKLRSFLKNLDGRDAGGLDSLKGLNKESSLREFYRTAQEYVEVAKENYGLEKALGAHGRLSKNLPGSQKKIDDLVSSLKESRFIRESVGGQGFNPRLASQVFSRFGNAALGGVAFGPVGVAAGLLLGGIADGASAARKLATVEHLAGRSRDAINKRLDAVVEHMIKGGPGGTIPRRPNRTKLFLAPLAAQFGEEMGEGEKSTQDHYATAKQRAMNLTGVGTLPDMLGKITEPISHEMPNLSTALQAKMTGGMEYAVEGFNKDSRTITDKLMGVRERQPTDRELAQQDIRLATIEDPINEFCGALESGTCTKTHSETMQRVWPNLFATLKAGFYERLSDREDPVPYQWKLTCGIAFGEPFDVSQKPENITILQASYGAKPEGEGKIKSSPLIKHPGLGPTEVEKIMMG